MRQSLHAVFLSAAALAGLASPAAALDAPKPVACASKASCDQDPDHLTAYVNAFYEWLVASRAEIFKNVPDTAQDKRNAAFSARDKIALAALGPKLRKLYTAQWSAMDGQNSAPDCQDHDSDVLTCTVNYPDAWLQPVHSSLTPGGKSVALVVTLPKFQYVEAPTKNATEFDGRTVAVTLVADKGVWKIDRVTDQGVKP
jgi:hypothetical protein